MLQALSRRLATARTFGTLKSWTRKDYYQDPARGLHGKHPPEHRLGALRSVLDRAAGCTLLDLGCAEGLIAEQFVRAGAREILGIDCSAARVAAARRLVGGAARFEAADVSDWDAITAWPWLRPRYDIVLFLGLYQHLPEPTRAATLDQAARRCDDTMAVRMPIELMAEADGVLRHEGLVPVEEIGRTGLGVGRCRIYRRFRRSIAG
jgi:2-polyprenyl-3-methyl-5-hydroxy-6-metoxy-1,4-benzoquinol methylase